MLIMTAIVVSHFSEISIYDPMYEKPSCTFYAEVNSDSGNLQIRLAELQCNHEITFQGVSNMRYLIQRTITCDIFFIDEIFRVHMLHYLMPT